MTRGRMPVESRRGFTLIEVMLVLAIAVIIAGLSWAAMQGPMARWRCQGGRRRPQGVGCGPR